MWETWLLGAAALHLGFQATVTLLVYPTLLDAGRRGNRWAEVHAAHSRRITPLVAVVYGALLPPVVVTAWRLPDTGSGGGALAVAGAALALVATAAVAAPAHRGLARGWAEAAGARLARADAVRLAGAAVCLAGAVIAR